jgi:iron complex outermembrane receptor protein
MRTSTGFRPSVSCAVATAILFSAAGHAQGSKPAAESVGLEEITITARKVEENLMSVPIAITAFSAKDIENANIKQLNDVMLRTPSFNFVNQQGGSGRNDRSTNALVFRGLYLGSNIGLSAGGSLFIDGAPVVGSQPPAINDVERIEVLKGPQSAYFGRNTFAGAINFVTRDPSTSFKGRLNAEASSWQSYDTSVSVEGSLTEHALRARHRPQLRSRRSIHELRRSGRHETRWPNHTIGLDDARLQAVRVFQDQSLFKRVPRQRRSAGAGRAEIGIVHRSRRRQWQLHPVLASTRGHRRTRPGRKLTRFVRLRMWHGAEDQRFARLHHLGDWDMSSPIVRATLFTPPNPAWAIFDTSFNTHGGFKREAFQSDVRADYEFAGGYTFTSLTAAHRDKTMTLIDLNYRDGHDRKNPLNAIPANASKTVAWDNLAGLRQSRFEDWSQVFRITSPQEAKFRWTAGANYFDGKTPGGCGVRQLGHRTVVRGSDHRAEGTNAGVLRRRVLQHHRPNHAERGEGRYQTDKLTPDS